MINDHTAPSAQEILEETLPKSAHLRSTGVGFLSMAVSPHQRSGPLPSQLNLGENSVHIWVIQLQPQMKWEEADLEGCLSQKEVERLYRFKLKADRNQYLASHYALRVILGRYLGTAPELVQFETTQNEKPILSPGSNIHFNLAHSGSIALVSLTAIGEIGVDVEHLRELDDVDSLAGSCFSPAEYHKFSRVPKHLSQMAFFSTWTRKEAFIKATGEGLSFPLDQFEVSMWGLEPPRLNSIAGSVEKARPWILRDIPIDQEYAAAFAIRAKLVEVSYLTFQEW